MAEIPGRDPRDGGGGGLLGAAIRIAEEVVDGPAGFEEAGAGKLDLKVTAACDQFFGEASK